MSKKLRLATLASAILTVFALIVTMIYAPYFSMIYARILVLLLGIFTFSRLQIGDKARTYIAILMCALMLALTTSAHNYSQAYFELSLLARSNLNNPNGQALALVIAYIFISNSNLFKRVVPKLVLALVTYYGVLSYGSRSGLICLSIFILLNEVQCKFSTNIKKALVVFVVVVGLVFPYLYTYTYNIGDTNARAAVILNKSVYSGRQDVWNTLITDQSKNNLFLGTYSLTKISQLPAMSTFNTYLDISYRLGFVFLIFYVASILLLNEREMQNLPGYIALLLYGAFESTMLSGSYIGIFMLFMLFTPIVIVSKRKGTSRQTTIKEKTKAGTYS
jgi:hypothetical protein